MTHYRLQAGEDEYSLLVNLKRLYELQLKKSVSNDGLFEDMASILRDMKDLNNEACDIKIVSNYHFFFLYSTYCNIVDALSDSSLSSSQYVLACSLVSGVCQH